MSKRSSQRLQSGHSWVWGKPDLDEFLDWLNTVERVFDYMDIWDEKKVKLVALKLRKYASTWWDNFLSKWAKKGKSKIKS